jgi:hypothetical protein
MDIGFQQLRERRMDLAVAGDRAQAPKRLGDDAHTEVTEATGRARVARMQVTLVLDIKFHRREPPYERSTDALAARSAVRHGDCAWAGMILPCNQITWGTMKSIIAAVSPNTLKLTHTLSAKFRAT